MKYTKEDVKTAFIEIARILSVFMVNAIKIVGLLVTGIVILGAFVGLVFHFFFQMLIAITLGFFIFWVLVELRVARDIRIYNEQVDRFRAEKNKPAHKEMS